MERLRALLTDPRSRVAAALVGALVWTAIGLYDVLLIEALRPYQSDASVRLLPPLARMAKHLALLPFVLLTLHWLADLRRRQVPLWQRLAVLVLCAFAVGYLERLTLGVSGVLSGTTSMEGMTPPEALLFWLTSNWGLVLRSVGQNAASVAVTALAVAAWRDALEALATQRRVNEVQVAGLNQRLTALENEISPHFLFNALHHAVAQTREPATRAELVDLSELLRYVLHGRNQPTVTLEEDLEFTRSYLEVCRRQGAGVAVAWQVAPAALRARVPRMLVHLLIENAFRHASELAPAGAIDVAISADDGRLTIAIENDFRPGARLAGTGIGLSNARERIEILFPGRSRLESAAASASRWRTRVELPLEQGA